MSVDCGCALCVAHKASPAGDEDLKLAVKHGAAWLNEHDPEWVEKISLESLNMRDTGQCVLGQVLGSYWEGHRYVDSLVWDEWVLGCGFDTYHFNDYVRLRDAWADYIIEERGSNVDR